MSIIEVKNVSKIFKTANIEVKALQNINLTVEKGEFVTIIGPSGSGKSTLLHLIGGLEKITEGEIYVEGKNIKELKENALADYRRTQIGFVFQQYNLIPMLSAKENIILPLAIENEKVDPKYFNQLTEILGIEDRLTHLPGELSGGQQQRIALARALITKPSVILADEPTGNLDRKTSIDVITLLQKSCKELNQTILMITHDMELAQKADKIYKIIDGKI